MLNRLTQYMQGDGFQARAFRGTALTFVSFGGQNALRLGSNLLLTRLLFPEAFGLMALVQVVLTGVAMLSDIGLRGSIIQDKRGGEQIFLDTAWTMQIIRGVVLGIAVFLLSEPVAAFYEEPLLAQLLMVSAVIPVIKATSSTRMAVANRKMILGRLTALQLGVQAFEICVMVVLAWWLQSVWALIFGPIAGAIVLAFASHMMMPGQRNRLRFELDSARRLFSFGKWIFVSTLATFFIRHGDRAVLGKFIDLDELAFFRIAFLLAAIPTMFSRKLTERVIFPLYARKPPAESKEYRRKINKARMLLTASFILATAFLAVIGDWLIKVLYDPRYESAGILLVLIAVFSMPALITVSYHKLPASAGKSGRYATLTIVTALVQAGLLLALVPTYGVVGAIVSPAISTILTYPLLIWIIGPFKGWDPRHDAVFAALIIAVSALVFWIHQDGILTLLSRY